MKISYIHITNFVGIKDLEIKDVENALILVGRNNTGKTIVIDAIRAAAGDYKVSQRDFLDISKNIEIEMKVEFLPEDLEQFNKLGIVGKYKKYELWLKDFSQKLPSFKDGVLSFKCIINKQGVVKYDDGFKRNNKHIKEVFPKIYYIDHSRNLDEIKNEILGLYDKDSLMDLKRNLCIFDKSKKCTKCFNCIGLINQKSPVDLTVYETARLMEYKLLNINVTQFSERLNKYFHRNGSNSQDISFGFDFNVDEVFSIDAVVHNKERGTVGPVSTLSEGLKSIFTLSLLEAYIDEETTIPCIIMIEDPEIYLHPSLQKTSSEVLFRLSKKNQVIFSTHSPNLIFNFSSKQIRQVVLDEEYHTTINEDADIDEILDDLGYTANDLMNVSFVFIVEGKQDSNRLPLLLEKYYSEIFDEDGNLQRVAIIPTNSCTNIKTYANLKYINKLYLKDQFLMIRDSDGKNPKHLVKQLCSYYSARAKEDDQNIPRITPRNVLILKYYSFENYFLVPEVMVQIGVIKRVEDFYTILYNKYKDYLYRLGSVRRMIKYNGIRINSKEDIKKNMETIKIYVRGHNLFDIFYGRYRGDAQTDILKRYIDVAPKDTFKDIFDAIDSFVYFENRRKDNEQ